MSIGSSGRVVIEIEPALKRQLYASLLSRGLSLKEWFIANAELFLEENQKSLFQANQFQEDKKHEN